MKRGLKHIGWLVARISRHTVSERSKRAQVPRPAATFYEGDDVWPDETTAVEPRQSMAELMSIGLTLPSM